MLAAPLEGGCRLWQVIRTRHLRSWAGLAAMNARTAGCQSASDRDPGSASKFHAETHSRARGILSATKLFLMLSVVEAAAVMTDLPR